MFKKILITMFLIMSLFVSGYSADHYLNGCGNSVWTNGDTYYLNFSSETSISGSPCFSGNLNGVTINQLNEKLIFKKSGGGELILFNGDVDNTNFENLNIKFDEPSTFIKSTNACNNNIFTNSIILNFKNLIDNNLNSDGNEYYNTFLYGDGLYYSGANADYNNKVIDSIMILNSHNSHYTYYPINWNFTRSSYYDNQILNTCSGCTFEDTLFLKKDISSVWSVRVDSNNDGKDDLNPSKYKIGNSHLIRGKKYITFQDFNEGEGDGTYNYLPVSYTDDETTSIFYFMMETLPTFTTTLKGNNFFQNSLSFSNVNNLGLNGNIICDMKTDLKCIMNDNAYSGSIVSEYRPLIIVNSDKIINGIEFTKSGSNNAHIIANSNDNLKNNITLTKNLFWKQTGVLTGGDTSSNEVLKLKYNNVNIYDNEFLMTGTNEVFELISIEGTSATTNKVHNNSFINNVNTPNNSSVIFNSYCDTEFYNNFVGSNIVLQSDG